ncbi:hypothetical protein LINPERHAP2_LOCUS4768 [Linum perenne]
MNPNLVCFFSILISLITNLIIAFVAIVIKAINPKKAFIRHSSFVHRRWTTCLEMFPRACPLARATRAFCGGTVIDIARL